MGPEDWFIALLDQEKVEQSRVKEEPGYDFHLGHLQYISLRHKKEKKSE